MHGVALSAVQMKGEVGQEGSQCVLVDVIFVPLAVKFFCEISDTLQYVFVSLFRIDTEQQIAG